MHRRPKLSERFNDKRFNARSVTVVPCRTLEQRLTNAAIDSLCVASRVKSSITDLRIVPAQLTASISSLHGNGSSPSICATTCIVQHTQTERARMYVSFLCMHGISMQLPHMW